MRIVHKWSPQKPRFKRLHRGALKSMQYRLSARRPQQGGIGFALLKATLLSVYLLEQLRRQFLRMRKKREKIKFWFHSCADVPITAKSLGFRMGKGKGAVKSFVTKVPAGKIIFQLQFLKKNRAIPRFRQIQRILSSPMRLIQNPALHQNNLRIQ